eukprot:scaffold1954_cov268-Pinguiococcus_pyrenoidosus.AAC.57
MARRTSSPRTLFGGPCAHRASHTSPALTAWTRAAFSMRTRALRSSTRRNFGVLVRLPDSGGNHATLAPQLSGTGQLWRAKAKECTNYASGPPKLPSLWRRHDVKSLAAASTAPDGQGRLLELPVRAAGQANVLLAYFAAILRTSWASKTRCEGRRVLEE